MLADGQVCKGILHAIAGDNLGSHNIGGFFEINHIKSMFRDLKTVQAIVEVTSLTLCSMSYPSFMYVSLDCLHDLFEGIV